MAVVAVAAAVIALVFPATPARAPTAHLTDAAVADALTFGGRQLDRTHSTLSPRSYPISTDRSGAWKTKPASAWTSGFLAGGLWLKYRETRDPAWRSKARARQAGLERQKLDRRNIDLGFMIFNSFGSGYKLTREDADRDVVRTAAASVASRYSPVVRMTRSWNVSESNDVRVITDNLMNLELLFWASKHGGERGWFDIAKSHALRAREDFVRADGSTYHVVNYDPGTGAIRNKETHQGHNAESAWSRGQAWAIYAFTMAYRESDDPRFLDTARRVADYYLAHLPPDKVPYWDFEAPEIPNEPRDSSAAAVAASALLELAKRESDSARARAYRGAAESTLAALTSQAYMAKGTTNAAILVHGTRNKPAGDYDTGTIWGDYYLLEALLRYRGQ